jgi:hypothetical protein
MHGCRRVCIAPTRLASHARRDVDVGALHLGVWTGRRLEGRQLHLTLHDGCEVVATLKDGGPHVG